MDKINNDKDRDSVPVPSLYKNNFAYVLEDMAMVSEKNPAFSLGDVLLINPHVEPTNDDYILLKMDEDATEICRLYSVVENKITFRPLNTNYYAIHPKNNYTIIGVVSMVLSRPKKQQ